MSASVVHVEVTGPDAASLTRFYARAFGWHAQPADAAAEVAASGGYAFVQTDAGPPVGIGATDEARLLFYVGVDDVEAALAAAQDAGATRLFGPVANPDGSVVVGQFLDPAGNRVGVAAPAASAHRTDTRSTPGEGA